MENRSNNCQGRLRNTGFKGLSGQQLTLLVELKNENKQSKWQNKFSKEIMKTRPDSAPGPNTVAMVCYQPY